jgi:flagellin
MDMSLRINTNVEAFNAHRQLVGTQTLMSRSMEKLSSGLRINRAADDAAGLAISEKMRAQIRGIDRAHQNAMDGISMVQTGEGALNEVHSILQRMRDLSVQASNGGANDADAKGAAQKEFAQLNEELDRIGDTTSFGKNKLLDGNYSGTFQVGANAGEEMTIDIDAISSSDLGTDALDLTTGASGAITTIDDAIQTVSDQRASLGAYQNRFEHTINNLNVAVENLSASESRIRDTDMAQEMVSFTRSQILTQAGTSMLSQANQASQNVLSLLR